MPDERHQSKGSTGDSRILIEPVAGLRSVRRFREMPGQIQGNHMAEEIKLDGHHRATVEKIFRHPASHNIQWHDVLSLLESVAEVTERHGAKYKVTLGPETETLEAPKGSDIDEQMVIDLRRMLKGAGIVPESE
jgi:hypothetical protein